MPSIELENTLHGAEYTTIVVEPGRMREIGATGEFVTGLQADGELELSVNHGSRVYFTAGITYRTRAGVFTTVQLFNETSEPITIKLAWGYGELVDRRLTSTSHTPVINPAGQELATTDATAQSALSAILAMMQNANDQRAGLTDLSNAQYAEAINTTSTVVTTSQNQNGVIIRTASLSILGSSSSFLAYVYAGPSNSTTDILIGVRSRSDTSANGFAKDIYVPPGNAIRLNSSGIASPVTIFYEVL